MNEMSEESIQQMAASALLHRCDRVALVDVSTFACRFIKHPSATQEDRDLQASTDIVTYFKRAMAWGLVHSDDLLECHRRMQQFVTDTDRRLNPVERSLRLRYRHGDGFAWMELLLLPVPGKEHLRLFCLRRSEENNANEALRGVWGQFHKILRVDLGTGVYEPIKLEREEASNMASPPGSIWQWMEDFAGEAHVHPDDITTYLEFIEKMRQHRLVVQKAQPCKTIYRRRQEEGWRWVIMEIVPSLDYTEDNQIVILYVLDVHDFLAEKNEHNRILREKVGTFDWDDPLAAENDIVRLLHSDANTGPGLIFANLDGLPPFKP